MDKKTDQLKKYWSPFCLLINLVLYVGFALLDGPVWCRDSNSYATMDYTREPIYPTFLWIMRKIFGENVMVHGWDLTDRLGGKVAAEEPLYLMATIVCQSVLAAVTVWLLAKTCYEIGKKFRYAAMANLVMWGVDILNRFGAKRGSTYTQSIMTEGFGISFYILFLLSLFQYLRRRIRLTKEKTVTGSGIRENRKDWGKYLFLTVLMMTVCASQHKQLTITLLIFAVSTFVTDFSLLKNRRRTGHWLTLDLAALACAGGLIFLVGHVYNLTFHGVWSFHTGSADKIDSTLLYTVTEEDAQLFSESFRTSDSDAETELDNPDHLQTLFLQIEKELTEQRLRYVDIQTDEKTAWVELCSHYADSYDIIGFEVLDPLVDTYVRIYRPDLTPGSMEFAIATDHVCQSLERVLLHQNPKRLLYLWINNVRKGFVNTVLRVGAVLNWASLILWILYGTVFGRLIRNMRAKQKSMQKPAAVFGKAASADSTSKNDTDDADVILLAALVFLGTLVNCAVVGAIIFPQTRYMIYNMGMFYIALFLMMGGQRAVAVK